MSKYSDIVALLDYFDRKSPKEKRTRKEKDPDDPFTSILRMKRMADEFKKFTDDIEKINKKDDKDKKDGWDKMNFLQKFIILNAVVPFVVLLQFGVPALIVVKMFHLHP